MVPETALYVLDLNSFNWYVPKIIGKIPSGRSNHKTVLIGKYMVVTFGKYNNFIINTVFYFINKLFELQLLNIK